MSNRADLTVGGGKKLSGPTSQYSVNSYVID